MTHATRDDPGPSGDEPLWVEPTRWARDACLLGLWILLVLAAGALL